MIDAVGFALISGLCIGVIGTTLFFASAYDAVTKKRIKNGLMESDGVVYRITRLD